MNLGSIISRQSGYHGDKDALVEVPSGRNISYARLARRIETLAAAFVAHPQLRKGDRVAIMSMNSIEFIECCLAAASAGMVAQGMNWRLSEAELIRILEDSTPSVIVTGPQFGDQAAAFKRAVDAAVWLEFSADGESSYEDFVATGDTATVMPETRPEEPVLMMYTGGSTGVPKGVLHSHLSCQTAMVNNAVGERVVPSDRYMLMGQMFHSAAVLVLDYLANGATVVLMERYETELALEALEAERITAFLGFTTMMNYMLNEMNEKSTVRLDALRNLQYGGGPYAPEVIEQIIAAFPCGIIQNYGTTEHIGISFLSQEDHDEARAGRNMHRLRSGGRAAFMTDIAILDTDGQALPVGAEGEIFARSPANMIGYWQQPEQTAEIRRGEWLGTGDIGVIDDDGYIYVVGRAKDMIISGGENIYAAQVERALASHATVLEAAVIGEADETWGERVVAYVVKKPGAEVSAGELRETVGERLASYQKPRTVRFVDALPKSPNGKVLKQELRTAGAGEGADEVNELSIEIDANEE